MRTKLFFENLKSGSLIVNETSNFPLLFKKSMSVTLPTKRPLMVTGDAAASPSTLS